MKHRVQWLYPFYTGFLLVAFASAGCGESPLHIPDSCRVDEADDDCLWSNNEEGRLVIHDLEDLETVCGSPCSKARSIRLSLRDENEELSILTGFDFVTDVSTLSISVRHTQHIAAFANIEEVNYLEFDLNQKLEVIEPFPRLERLHRGGLFLKNNPLLKDLTAFSNLRTIGHPDLDEQLSDVFLHLFGNHALVDLRGLENLEYVHRIYIAANDGLESFKGLDSLEEIQSMEISGNRNLSSLEGLENLRTVHQGLLFRNSPNIRRCEIEALIDQLETGPGGVTIQDVSEDPCE